MTAKHPRWRASPEVLAQLSLEHLPQSYPFCDLRQGREWLEKPLVALNVHVSLAVLFSRIAGR